METNIEKVTTNTKDECGDLVENTVTSTENIESDNAIVTDEGGKPAKGKETWAGTASKFITFMAKHKTFSIVMGTLIGILLIGIIIFFCTR